MSNIVEKASKYALCWSHNQLEELLSNGVSPNSKYRGKTLIEYALHKPCIIDSESKFRTLEVLLRYGGNTNKVGSKNKGAKYPIHIVIGNNGRRIHELMASYNTDIYVLNKARQSAMYLAAREGDLGFL